ncbi:MAG: Septum site-determining protein MinD [bacterium ADurb.Bin478]|nr:MAG: Septum site-determining protein MinD [bacterium ADurb.Bin478]
MEKALSWIYISNSEDKPGDVFHHLERSEKLHLAGRSENWSSAQALLNKLQPELALLDLSQGEEGLRWLEKWSVLFPHTLFFCTAASAAPELIVHAMRKGACEFLLPKMPADEIERVVLSAHKRSLEGGIHTPARVICCYGVKGGVGATTLATNLAVFAAKQLGKRVLLLDLKMQLGNAALFLDLKPRISLLELVENLSSLETAQLRSTLARHHSGVTFIAGPENMEQADNISPAAVAQIIDLLRPEFDFIFIDSDSYFSEVTLRALDEADTILTIAQLDVAAIYNLKRTLALFQRLGYRQEKVAVILNRYPQRMSDDLELIEKSISSPIFIRLPLQENGALIESVNTGEPVIMTKPQLRFSQQVAQLLQLLQGGAAEPAVRQTKRGLFKRWVRE